MYPAKGNRGATSGAEKEHDSETQLIFINNTPRHLHISLPSPAKRPFSIKLLFLVLRTHNVSTVQLSVPQQNFLAKSKPPHIFILNAG